MENEPLKEKLERAQRDFTTLYEISNAMRTTLELKHILYIILTGVTSHTGLGYNRAILFLANDDYTWLEPQMAIGPKSVEHAQEIWAHIQRSNQGLEDLIKQDKLEQSSDPSSLFKQVKDLRIPLGVEEANILSKSFFEGTARHISEDEVKKYADDVFFKSFATNELVIVPLKVKDKIIGLITADNIFTRKSPTKDDLRMFMVLANQAALAIENSRLYELTNLRSHTDPVTNLWNHGFFQYKLSSLLEEARSQQKPLSMALIDIDDFKKLNDNYGHQQGDLILRSVARLLSESSRESDYVCRYGGEEFSIILAHTHKQEALAIAERARRRIADNHFMIESQMQPITVTVSIGVANFPDDAPTKEDLINKADEAMYTAKRAGKNRTVAA
jgi:diguanylate cyclase (GGDEF)-like protein